MEYSIERLDVLSLAKVVGVIGLLWGVIVAITWLAIGVVGGPFPGAPELVASTVGSLVAGILVGGITAILYNAAASLIGGLELELVETGH